MKKMRSFAREMYDQVNDVASHAILGLLSYIVYTTPPPAWISPDGFAWSYIKALAAVELVINGVLVSMDLFLILLLILLKIMTFMGAEWPKEAAL